MNKNQNNALLFMDRLRKDLITKATTAENLGEVRRLKKKITKLSKEIAQLKKRMEEVR